MLIVIVVIIIVIIIEIAASGWPIATKQRKRPLSRRSKEACHCRDARRTRAPPITCPKQDNSNRSRLGLRFRFEVVGLGFQGSRFEGLRLRSSDSVSTSCSWFTCLKVEGFGDRRLAAASTGSWERQGQQQRHDIERPWVSECVCVCVCLSLDSPEETPNPRRDSEKTGRYHVC